MRQGCPQIKRASVILVRPCLALLASRVDAVEATDPPSGFMFFNSTECCRLHQIGSFAPAPFAPEPHHPALPAAVPGERLYWEWSSDGVLTALARKRLLLRLTFARRTVCSRKCLAPGGVHRSCRWSTRIEAIAGCRRWATGILPFQSGGAVVRIADMFGKWSSAVDSSHPPRQIESRRS